MSVLNASRAGTFRIGGELEIARLGFGALHLSGPGHWGPPADRDAALRLLRRLPEIGVNFIDTADSYGPDVSEELIREALHPYDGIVVATKAGMMRDGPELWRLNGRPEHLIAQAKASLVKLRVDRIDLWHLHRIDPAVPVGEQFDAVRWLLDQGLIRHAGLSQVSIADIRAAQRVFPVATVQNLYNLADRRGDDELAFCEAHGIGFIPWHPLASGGLSAGSALDDIARRKGVAPNQLALAWLLRRSPVVIPIPGTTKMAHLEENVAAVDLALDDRDLLAGG